MDAVQLLAEQYQSPKAFAIVLDHSWAVAQFALALASSVPHLAPDTTFIEEAALLHDIGVAQTSAHHIDCHGSSHYLSHGVIGADIVRAAGYPRHARVCECHIGVGLTVADIRSQALPLPLRDMVPLTIEEIIVSFADLFYSKKLATLRQRKTLANVQQSLAQYGSDKLVTLESWLELFPSAVLQELLPKD